MKINKELLDTTRKCMKKKDSQLELQTSPLSPKPPIQHLLHTQNTTLSTTIDELSQISFIPSKITQFLKYLQITSLIKNNTQYSLAIKQKILSQTLKKIRTLLKTLVRELLKMSDTIGGKLHNSDKKTTQTQQIKIQLKQLDNKNLQPTEQSYSKHHQAQDIQNISYSQSNILLKQELSSMQHTLTSLKQQLQAKDEIITNFQQLTTKNYQNFQLLTQSLANKQKQYDQLLSQFIQYKNKNNISKSNLNLPITNNDGQSTLKTYNKQNSTIHQQLNNIHQLTYKIQQIQTLIQKTAKSTTTTTTDNATKQLNKLDTCSGNCKIIDAELVHQSLNKLQKKIKLMYEHRYKDSSINKGKQNQKFEETHIILSSFYSMISQNQTTINKILAKTEKKINNLQYQLSQLLTILQLPTQLFSNSFTTLSQTYQTKINKNSLINKIKYKYNSFNIQFIEQLINKILKIHIIENQQSINIIIQSIFQLIKKQINNNQQSTLSKTTNNKIKYISPYLTYKQI